MIGWIPNFLLVYDTCSVTCLAVTHWTLKGFEKILCISYNFLSEMIQSTTEKSSGKSRRWVRFPNLTEADKARIVSLKVAKWNHDKIAMSVGCSVSTVYRVLKKWNKAKRHYVYLKVGCPLVFTEQIKARIVEKMNEKGAFNNFQRKENINVHQVITLHDNLECILF